MFSTNIGLGRGIKEIIFGEEVTRIGDYSFVTCSDLTSVTIGSAVTSIGAYAFVYSNIAKTIWLTNTPPSGYKEAEGTINYVPNNQYSSLKKTIVYQFLSSIFEFDGIKYLPVSPSERTCDAIDCVYNKLATNTKIMSEVSYKGITMEVKKVQPYIAYNNNFIETLLVDYDGEIPEYAFAKCSNVKSYIIGEKCSDIGQYAFYGCSNLTSAIMGKKDSSTSEGIFIGENIMGIGDYAFYDCKEIDNVIISDRREVLRLGSNGSNSLFSSCQLDSVYIGGDISYQTDKDHGYSPFYRNTYLRAIRITDKETEISENEFYGCTNLQSITIGDGVTSIGNRAFSGCLSLEHFAFGSHVKDIGQEAFSDCKAMKEITSKSATPPVCGDQALDDINKWECKLIVPKGCIGAYESADQWKEFFFKEEGIGSIEQESSSIIIGDANGDGNVDEADVNAIANHIIGKTLADFDTEAADVNKDGKVNAADIVVLVNMIRNK